MKAVSLWLSMSRLRPIAEFSCHDDFARALRQSDRRKVSRNCSGEVEARNEAKRKSIPVRDEDWQLVLKPQHAWA
jgi:hypothetical protein